MSKIAVVYWSGTGNTEAMANAVLEGAKDKGADAVLFTSAEFDDSMMDAYDAVAFGCRGNSVLQNIGRGAGRLDYQESCYLRRRILPEIFVKYITGINKKSY